MAAAFAPALGAPWDGCAINRDVCCTLCTCQILAGVAAAAAAAAATTADGVEDDVVSSTLSAELLLPLLSSPEPALFNELTPLSEPLSP